MPAKNLGEAIAELEARIVEARRRVTAMQAERAGDHYCMAVGYLDALTSMRDWMVGAPRLEEVANG